MGRHPPQVFIQALLVEVQLGNTDEFGVEVGVQDSVLFNRSVVNNLVTLTQTVTSPNGTQTTNQNVVSQTSIPGFHFNNQPLGNNTTVSPSTVGTQGLSNLGVGRVNGDLGYGGLVLSASSESVSVLLRALSAHHQIDILSRPQIRTLDNHEAVIQIGQQVPVVDGVAVTAVGSANPVIRQDQAGIILRVLPRIGQDGLVQMNVNAEKSAFQLAAGTGVPIFTDATNGNVIEAPVKDVTSAETVVSARDGQTIILGGMITRDQTTVSRRVPWLGDIPVVGMAFRYDSSKLVRKELLIFLTPHVLLDEADESRIKQIEAEKIDMPWEPAYQMHGPILDDGLPYPGYVPPPETIPPPQVPGQLEPLGQQPLTPSNATAPPQQSPIQRAAFEQPASEHRNTTSQHPYAGARRPLTAPVPGRPAVDPRTPAAVPEQKTEPENKKRIWKSWSRLPQRQSRS
ncbi:hypothetical protein SH661x_002366 [Planctomicrobium sp. SH661]|uniref:type II secretion system protein GspD n=1 Tax=Planctomicrobium sp. SH661 TaxID=3448124 RepID=UPI003F5C7763